ncbi:MAG TPA: hypothetical protein VMG59_02755 [Phycisphaerae bacterium]|nr:hypothetical protein [Phycisphaerae bacterium]
MLLLAWRKYLFLVVGFSAAVMIGGCTHIAGTVEWENTNQPVTGAQVSVGEPGGDFVSTTHSTDAHGKFSFDINPLDVDDVWVWSGQGNPALNAVHVDPDQVNDHMTVQISQ